ncbi:hypothetical protein Acr_26g0012580 [Actinidia rufa]|uniref:Uncharacterized protein n=1 Tax=Actinidia rufa TaxID=165716 RepID=A0A7J0H4K3_9ERIC|nr:hypothetical protein Acr_26g0012580 [Actinidia rufa]
MASKIASTALAKGFVVAQRVQGEQMHAVVAAVDVRAGNIPPPVPEPTWNLQG